MRSFIRFGLMGLITTASASVASAAPVLIIDPFNTGVFGQPMQIGVPGTQPNSHITAVFRTQTLTTPAGNPLLPGGLSPNRDVGIVHSQGPFSGISQLVINPVTRIASVDSISGTSSAVAQLRYQGLGPSSSSWIDLNAYNVPGGAFQFTLHSFSLPDVTIQARIRIETRDGHNHAFAEVSNWQSVRIGTADVGRVIRFPIANFFDGGTEPTIPLNLARTQRIDFHLTPDTADSIGLDYSFGGLTLVPEPSSAMLLIIGSAALLRRRAR